MPSYSLIAHNYEPKCKCVKIKNSRFINYDSKNTGASKCHPSLGKHDDDFISAIDKKKKKKTPSKNWIKNTIEYGRIHFRTGMRDVVFERNKFLWIGRIISWKWDGKIVQGETKILLSLYSRLWGICEAARRWTQLVARTRPSAVFSALAARRPVWRSCPPDGFSWWCPTSFRTWRRRGCLLNNVHVSSTGWCK